MNTKPPRHQFEELLIPRKELPKLSSHYRVYKDSANFMVVEAENALEAMKKSGLQQVHRIVRDAIYLTNVLNLEELSKSSVSAVKEGEEAPAVTAASPLPAAEAQSAASPAAVETPVPDTPLSTDDVDKLLKSDNATGAA